MTLSAAGLALAVLVATGLLWPPIVAALPERSTANPGATGLQFRGVHSETIFVGQGLTLVVEGEIVNTRAESLSLPAVRIALKTVDGKDVTAWRMQPSSARLAGGQSIAFRSARASPPASATQVTLSLAY